MAQAPTPAVNPTKSTQNSLLITEIKDGIVVMRDGSLRSVILSSAINFDLMSSAEQNAVEYSYQGFLNSLHFPIQIIVKSQKMDLDGYIEDMSKKRAEQENELLGILMDDYIANIKALLEEVNIMDKQFYVCVPYFPPLATPGKQNFFSNVASLFSPAATITVGENDFKLYKQELAQRVQLVASGLSQLGVRAIPLNTQELTDLFYASYNPDVAPNQKLIDASQLQTAAVTRGGDPLRPSAPPVQAAPMSPAQPMSSVQSPAAPPPTTPPAATPAPEPPRSPLDGGLS